MPFCVSPVAVADCGCVADSRCRAFRGSEAAGDGVFHEFARNDGRLLFLLVDVMGHGDPAAPFVELLSRRLLADPTVANLSPGQLLSRLHGMLAPVWAEEEVYICATAFAPDASNGCVSVANAGLPAPLFGVIGDGARVWDEAPDGVPLGLPEEDATYCERCLPLAQGAALFFTDGVCEAYRNTEGSDDLEFFGYDRLQSLWEFTAVGNPRLALIKRVFDELERFAGSEWPQDDVTTLCFELCASGVQVISSSKG